MQRRTGEFRPERFLERPYRLRRLQQAGTPLRETSSNLVLIFFRYEIIEAGLSLEEGRLERPLRAIVRMQVEFRADRSGFRLKRVCDG